jgi:FtsP/CotA-like multicopper oxidase with cupredoxin domain
MLHRRKLFHASFAGPAAALLGSPAIRAAAPLRPALTPFRDEVPVPPRPIAFERQGSGIPAGFENLDPEAATFVGPNTSFYKIVSEARRVSFHSELPQTEIWGYRDGNPKVANWEFALGPTFREFLSNRDPKDGVIVRHENRLPRTSEHRGFGEPRTTVHLHGAHLPSRFDGFPTRIILPDGTPFDPVFEHGGHFDYAYPMVDPALGGQAEHFERGSTLWYHDHILDFTGPNVYRGLTGFFLVHDNPVLDAGDAVVPSIVANTLDTGDETNAANAPNALRLPSGAFDVPLVLQEKTFGLNGELIFDPLDTDGFLGEQFVVNGKVRPYLNVKRRKYRFRFLNGSNARIYQLFLTDGSGRSYPMTQIATEGGLLSRSVPRPSFILAMAERVEVVIDFKHFPHPQFTELFIENRLVQEDGRGPGGTLAQPELAPRGTRLLQFRLGEVVDDDPSRVPAILRPFTAIGAATIAAARARTRTFEFERRNGQWAINGKFAGDLDQPIARAVADVGEVWRLVNKSGGWWHPVHVHLEYMRVLERDGRTPFGGVGHDFGQHLEADGLARKDVITLGPHSQVELFVRFSNYTGPYLFHCHNLSHEDHAMMARFDVVPATG